MRGGVGGLSWQFVRGGVKGNRQEIPLPMFTAIVHFGKWEGEVGPYQGSTCRSVNLGVGQMGTNVPINDGGAQVGP